MNKPADLKPRNLSAAVRLRLNEIENWLDRGLTRHEIAEILDSEYSFSVTAKGLEMALYRTRQNRKNVLHDKTGLCRLPFSFTWFCVLEYGRELPAYSHEKITERRPSAMKIHETLKLCRS